MIKIGKYIHYFSFILIVKFQLYKILVMLEPRYTQASKSIFYRGIPLTQYLRKSSVFHKNLEYKDDQTIFFDQDQKPVIIDDSFIITESKRKLSKIEVTPLKKSVSIERTPKNTQCLPLIISNDLKLHSKTNVTQQNSTDESINDLDKSNHLLPSIKKNIIRERNITKASRASSRSTSCRRKLPNGNLEGIVPLEIEETPKRKMSNRQYIQFLAKEREKQKTHIALGDTHNIKIRSFKDSKINRE